MQLTKKCVRLRRAFVHGLHSWTPRLQNPASPCMLECKIRLPNDLSDQNKHVESRSFSWEGDNVSYTLNCCLKAVDTSCRHGDGGTVIFDNESNSFKPAPNHACQLMQLSIEGPEVPDVRDCCDNEQKAWNVLLEKAYAKWLEQPRRGLIYLWINEPNVDYRMLYQSTRCG